MPITPQDLGVADEDLARRILVRARIIAPCLDTFPDDSEARKDAIAILKGVIAELPEPGSRRARSLSRNGTSITYADIDTAFDSDATASLRSLCGATLGALPLGSFPQRIPTGGLWPEGAYT